MSDTPITPGSGRLAFDSQPPKVEVADIVKWMVWHPLYLSLSIVTTLASIAFGCLPGWGCVVGAVFTVVAFFLGLKVSTQYIKATVR